MSSDLPPLPVHDEPEQFRDALTYTAAKTGFSARLIEKDYFCSILLRDFIAVSHLGLVFKGGACLSKIHAEFYRLSEDLDFGISLPFDAARKQRREAAKPLKEHLNRLGDRLPCFQTVQPLTGANESAQYASIISYQSVLTGQAESIKVEVSLREPVLDPAEQLPAATVLLDPFRDERKVPPFPVTAFSLREAFAEKLRAALTRRPPAIRDFYDLFHALRTRIIDLLDDGLVGMVRQKLLVPGNAAVDVTDAKEDELKAQLETQLNPVLRSRDYELFGLQEIFALVKQVANVVQGDVPEK